MNMPSRNSGRILMLRKMIMANHRRRKMLENGIALMLTSYELAVKSILLTAMMLISGHNITNDRHRSCRRSEMVGLAPCTVSTIVHEVNEAIISCLWECCITIHMPKTEDDFKKKNSRHGGIVAISLQLVCS